MKSLARFWHNQSGSGAAEFAMVFLPFAALIFAIIHLSMLFYANQSLQYATEAAARCYSVDSNNCGSIGNTENFATGRYAGPNIGAAFHATATGCGHTVTGTGNYRLNAVFVTRTVPLTVTACFP